MVLRQEPWLAEPPRTRDVAGCSPRSAHPNDLTTAWWCAQPRSRTQNHGQFLFYHDHFGRSNQTMKHNFPTLNRYRKLHFNDAFSGGYITIRTRWRHNDTRPRKARTWGKPFKWTHFMSLKAWVDLYHPYVCPVYIYNLTHVYFHITRGVCPCNTRLFREGNSQTMHGFIVAEYIAFYQSQ